MPFEEESRGFFSRFKKPFQIIFLIVTVGGTLGGVYYLTERMSPSPIAESTIRLNEDEMSDEEMLAEITQMESEFLSAWELGNITENDARKIARAVYLQERFNSKRGYNLQDVSRLTQLRKHSHNARALPLHREVKQLQLEIQRARDNGDDTLAIAKLIEAAKLQKEINDKYGSSEFENLQLETSFRALISNIELAPLRKQALDLETAGQQAEQQERWADAIANYEQAIEVHRQIIHKLPNNNSNNRARESALQGRLASLRSAGLHEKVNALVAEASQLEIDGHPLKAAELYLEAYQTQDTINDEFPRSDFESRDRAKDLLALSQMAKSRELADEIIADAARLDQLLLSGEVSRASRLVSELADKAERFRGEFPNSTVVTEDHILRLKILKLLRGNFGYLQQHIVSNLRTVPDFDGIFLFDHEVSQALYSAVMRSNPSQDPRGDDYPVSALSWNEAERFCERLSWILARPVRLPRPDEFKSAIGSLRYLSSDPRDAGTSINLNQISWNLANSEGRIQRVETSAANSAGFHDLLGNVAEWALPESSTGENRAIVMGGSAVDTTDSLLRLPQEERGRGERTRFIGFRFVVEWNRPLNPATTGETTTAAAR